MLKAAFFFKRTVKMCNFHITLHFDYSNKFLHVLPKETAKFLNGLKIVEKIKTCKEFSWFIGNVIVNQGKIVSIWWHICKDLTISHGYNLTW